MELVVYLYETRSLRLARLAGYAFVAIYGALAWMHNSVSEYLNRIGVVPHDRNIGIFLMWLALALSVLEALLFGIAAARKRIPPGGAGGSPLSPASSCSPTGG